MVGWRLRERARPRDRSSDNTKAFRGALLAVAGGCEVLVPAGTFRTAPANLTSNVVLRVDGEMRAVENRSAFPKIAVSGAASPA